MLKYENSESQIVTKVTTPYPFKVVGIMSRVYAVSALYFGEIRPPFILQSRTAPDLSREHVLCHTTIEIPR